MEDATLLERVPGRRERKKQATREALKAAAIALVAERGLARVTVEDIAEAVDVSVRTFFNYFPSKEAAVVGDEPARIEELRRELLELPSDVPPLAALRTVLVHRLRAMSEQLPPSDVEPGIWMRRLAALRSQPEVLAAYAKYFLKLERVLGEAVLQRIGGDEALRPYAAVVTSCALAAMRAASTTWGGEGGTEALVRHLTAAFGHLERGFAEPGRPATRARTAARSDLE